MPKSIVLLSAGLDSAVNLKAALDRGPVRAALTFDYGQRAARREEQSAAAMCARLAVHHETIRLPWLAAVTDSALVNRERALPHPTRTALDDPRSSRRSAARVWVPNRNGVFLAIAAGFAEGLGASEIVAGFNAEEAASFPDNSAQFIRAYNKTLQFSTRTGVTVKSYTARRRKPGIIALGLKIGAPLDLAWCCYEGGRRMCGRCESCRRFLRAAEHGGTLHWFTRHHTRMPVPPRRRP